MDKITLENTRDLPMTTNTLNFMQAAYKAFEQLGFLGGDNVIVSGCEVTGSSASPGYMFLNGILMPFIGGAIQTNVRIVTITTNVEVDAGVRQQTSFRAEFGTSTEPTENIPWADIVKLEGIKSLMAQLLINASLISGNTDEIAVNAAAILANSGRIDDLELDEIAWADLTVVWGGLQGNTSARACKIGKVIYIEGELNADYNPGSNTIMFQLPATFPLFTHSVRFCSAGAGEVGQLKALSNSRNIVSGASVNADSAQFFSVAIPVI